MPATGTYVTTSTAGETVRAFVPAPLPPDPPLQLASRDHDLIERANRALGRLDGVGSQLPDPSLFTYFYVRKEAVLSSQIEGTQSSFTDLVLQEHGGVPVPRGDVEEVSNYIAAMNHGLARIKKDAFPLSLRLVREMHRILVGGARGGTRQPGTFRTTQNWVGGSRPGNALFVPAPPDRVTECMGSLEAFLHDKPGRTPTLIKAALSHVQFETIHPFLDGNGRMGRMLITLVLCAEQAIARPLLYLSLYLKTHRRQYYDLLQQVRTEGRWLEWLRFFLRGVDETADQAADTATRILAQFRRDAKTIDAQGRSAPNLHRVHEALQRKMAVSVPEAGRLLALSAPTVRAAINKLQQLGIVREITGKERDRVYVYDPYMRILEEGTEPLGA